jgi:hypothetical protein
MWRRVSLEQSLFLVGISLFAWCWGGFMVPVLATHEIDHRFTIHGTVRDGRSFPGTLLAGKEVVIRDSKTGQVLQQGTTNQQGQFSLLLHIHNEDRGMLITIQSEGAEKTLGLQFDPADNTTERQAQVDLVVQPK